MTDRPLRFIHVGVGGWGRRWCDTFLHRAVVELGIAVPVAAVDLDPAQFWRPQQGYGIAPERCYTDAEAAFAAHGTEADFVVIVVPPAHHEAIVGLALRYDLHILSEKPIADTMASAARIHRKVTRAGVRMAVTMSHRFDADKQTLERHVRSGAYGAVGHLVCRLLLNHRRDGDWGRFRHRIADTLLIEAGVHYFDIVRALSGADARSVYASTWNPSWGEYVGDSTGLVVMEMTNGTRALFEGSMTSAASRNGWDNEYWRAECEGAILELDERRLRAIRGGSEETPVVEELPLDERPAWMNAWLAEWFVEWLRGRAPAPTTVIEDNIQCQALTMAAIESAHTGAPVDVQAYLARHLDEAATTLGAR
jgi:predicted dehydrogenase